MIHWSTSSLWRPWSWLCPFKSLQICLTAYFPITYIRTNVMSADLLFQVEEKPPKVIYWLRPLDPYWSRRPLPLLLLKGPFKLHFHQRLTPLPTLNGAIVVRSLKETEVKGRGKEGKAGHYWMTIRLALSSISVLDHSSKSLNVSCSCKALKIQVRHFGVELNPYETAVFLWDFIVTTHCLPICEHLQSITLKCFWVPWKVLYKCYVII